ncbi:hypothetical protein L7F22_008579 [Adiantum nelumboides]|nr:hypothetical protein [Adiantum nelumboides]
MPQLAIRERSSLRSCICSELLSAEGLAESPIGGGHVIGGEGAAIAGGDLEGEALPVQSRVALPVLPPVAAHGLPAAAGALDRDRVHVAHAAHVGDEHQVEVGVAVHGEVDATLLGTGHPPVLHRHNAAAVHPDLLKGWLRHVEVVERRVAPAARIVGQRGVGRAEIGGRHHHRGPSDAPFGVGAGIASKLKASTAAEAPIEEHRAEGGRLCAIPRGVEVAITASAPCLVEGRSALQVSHLEIGPVVTYLLTNVGS